MNVPELPFCDKSPICSIRLVFHFVSMPPGCIPITRLGLHLSSSWRFSSHHRKAHLLAPYMEKYLYGLNQIVAPIPMISALLLYISTESLLVRIAGAIILRSNVCFVFFQFSFSISSASPSPAQ